MLEKTNKLLHETMETLKKARKQFPQQHHHKSKKLSNSSSSDQDSFKPGSDKIARSETNESMIQDTISKLERQLEELQEGILEAQE